MALRIDIARTLRDATNAKLRTVGVDTDDHADLTSALQGAGFLPGGPFASALQDPFPELPKMIELAEAFNVKVTAS